MSHAEVPVLVTIDGQQYLGKAATSDQVLRLYNADRQSKKQDPKVTVNSEEMDLVNIYNTIQHRGGWSQVRPFLSSLYFGFQHKRSLSE